MTFILWLLTNISLIRMNEMWNFGFKRYFNRWKWTNKNMVWFFLNNNNCQSNYYKYRTAQSKDAVEKKMWVMYYWDEGLQILKHLYVLFIQQTIFYKELRISIFRGTLQTEIWNILGGAFWHYFPRFVGWTIHIYLISEFQQPQHHSK